MSTDSVIVACRMASGEDVVGRRGGTVGQYMTFHNPFILVPTQEGQIRPAAWAPYGQQEKLRNGEFSVELNTDHVVFMVEEEDLDPGLVEMYNGLFQKVIAPAQKIVVPGE